MLELDLVLEPEEAAFQARVRRFLAEKFTPELRREAELQTGVFAHGELAAKWHRILYEAGWVAPGWPEEYGGAGFTATQKYIFDQECARAGTPDLPVAGIRLCGPVLIEFGTPDQKDRFLPRILSGEHVWCQGYSEPQAGSDLAALECRAVRDGDHYVVTGQKVWTTHAQFANWIFVLVRTSREGPRQAGISFLLVPMDAPGITVRPIISMSGEHEVNEVFFDAVRVPVENLVGEENQGWKVAKFLLVNERGSGSAAAYLRNALGMLDKIVEPQGPFAANASDPTFARRRAEIEIEIAALEQSEHSLLEAMRQGGRGADDTLASIHKLHVSSLMQAITELEVDAIGEYAQIYQGEVLFGGREPSPLVPRRALTPVAHYLNMRAISIFGGSSEIQRNILTRTALGL
jgi:alkylation response protein AidB-like acyl-CoA dehydrogenase